MRRRNPFFLLAIGWAAGSAQAATVVYTDSRHPPAGLNDRYQVVYLDAPDIAQREVFGALSPDHHLAEKQARAIVQSADWQFKQQKIAHAYQAVLQAYTLRLKKYPAVVFDDRYVVYGTTDIALAEEKWNQYKQGAE